jgi:hypothetical protein
MQIAEPDQEEIRTVTISPWASTRVTALISAATFIVFTLVFLLTGGGQALIHRTVQIRTYFEDGTGLVRTADVQLDGIKVGEIKVIRPTDSKDPARTVEVLMNIQKNFLTKIPDDSKTEITADNLVGGKYINIKRGQSSRSIVADEELKRMPPAPNFDPADLLATVSATLRRATDLLDQVENPATPLGTLVKGEDLYTLIRDDIKAIEETVSQYGGPKSQIGKAIYGQDLYNQIRKPLLDMDKMLADIQNGQGQYGPLLKDSSQYDNTLASIRRFRASVQEIQRTPLLANEDQYLAALKLLRNLNATYDQLTQSDGQLAQLLTSAQLYEQFAGTTRETNLFLHSFRLNPQKYLRIKIF